MKLIDCGEGPFVILESVECENCGTRLYNTFDEFPAYRMYFPLIVRTEYVREFGPCVCKGQVRAATRPVVAEGLPYSGYDEIGPFDDGESIRVYEIDLPAYSNFVPLKSDTHFLKLLPDCLLIH